MANDTEPKKDEKIEKVEHENICEALAAFQGENPKLTRTKKVSYGEGTKKVEFWYTPLDEMLDVLRPLLSKHGLSFIHSGADGQIQCILFHESYEGKEEIGKEERIIANADGSSETIKTPIFEEMNILRSLPVKVSRSGEMKTIGTDSTYARRYTLGEVLGVAPEEDNDVSERMEALESSAMGRARLGINNAKTHEDLTKLVDVLEKNSTAVAKGETGSLGLKKEQLDELHALAVKRRTALGAPTKPPKPVPGENHDNGGESVVKND